MNFYDGDHAITLAQNKSSDWTLKEKLSGD